MWKTTLLNLSGDEVQAALSGLAIMRLHLFFQRHV